MHSARTACIAWCTRMQAHTARAQRAQHGTPNPIAADAPATIAALPSPLECVLHTLPAPPCTLPAPRLPASSISRLSTAREASMHQQGINTMSGSGCVTSSHQRMPCSCPRRLRCACVSPEKHKPKPGICLGQQEERTRGDAAIEGHKWDGLHLGLHKCVSPGSCRF